MLPAIGAASAALDAIQSLTSPQPATSSQPDGGFGPALSDVEDSSSAPQAASSALSGFSSALISSDNFNALIDAQSLTSGSLAGAVDSGGSDSSPGDQSGPSASASGTASSVYNSVNQLVQSTAIPLGFSPFSISA
jgi:hypothetical protein